MKSLITRSITGLIYVALIIGGLYFGEFVFSAIVFVLMLIATWEFLNLGIALKIKPIQSITLVSAAILYISFISVLLGYTNFSIIAVNIPFILSIAIIELFRNKNRPIRNIAYSIFSLVYIAFPLIALSYMYKVEPSNASFSFLLLGFFILQWVNDTFAYIFGRLFGKTKLFERISPQKTWEGFVGGSIASFAASILYGSYFGNIGIQHWIVISLIISIFGTLGDLIESMIKRSMKVKDSGKILPGHGGVLDRIDSILVSAPMVLAYLIIFFAYFHNI